MGRVARFFNGSALVKWQWHFILFLPPGSTSDVRCEKAPVVLHAHGHRLAKLPNLWGFHCRTSHHSIMSHVFDTKNPFVWCFSPLRSNKTPHCHLGSLPLVMCARWPRASASHAVLSLIPHPRIGAACFLITCQEVSVWVCVCVSFLKPFTTRARKTLISVILSSGCLGGAKMLTGRWVQCSCSASNFASAFFVTTHPRWGCDRQPTHFWLMAALGTLKWLL